MACACHNFARSSKGRLQPHTGNSRPNRPITLDNPHNPSKIVFYSPSPPEIRESCPSRRRNSRHSARLVVFFHDDLELPRKRAPVLLHSLQQLPLISSARSSEFHLENSFFLIDLASQVQRTPRSAVQRRCAVPTRPLLCHCRRWCDARSPLNN